jgi:hypothetical protein
MNVAVVVFVEICDGFDDLAGFLSGCSVVKVNEGIAIDFSV